MKMKTLCLVACAAMAVPNGASADQVFNDDVIIGGSLCVGPSCADGVNFQSDTLVLKGGLLRVLFEDTSSTFLHTTNDWRLIVNGAINSQGNYFAIEDASAGREVFRVDAGAPLNSVYVSGSGNVGFGTATPDSAIHVRSSSSPALRLELTRARPRFTHHIWDLVGNERQFFIRDVTGGKVPFRIRPGAPSSSFVIAADGNVGLGVAGPKAKLDVAQGGGGDVDIASFLNPGSTTNDRTSIYLGQSSTDGHAGVLSFVDDSDGLGYSALSVAGDDPKMGTGIIVKKGGKVGIGVASPSDRLTVNGGTVATQVHFGSTSSGAGGGFLVSDAPSQAIFSGGADFIWGNYDAEWWGWKARAAGSASIQSADGNLTFFTDSGLTVGEWFAPSQRMVIDQFGKVGLGTAAPEEALHVRYGEETALRLEQATSLVSTRRKWDVAGGYDFVIRDATDANNVLTPFRIKAGLPDDSFVIGFDGYVGIGEQFPSNKLTVNSGSTVTQVHFGSATSGAGGGFLVSNAPSQAIFSGGADFDLAWMAKATGSASIQSADGSLTFFTDSGLAVGWPFTPSQRMVIDQSGNVGIGTASPTLLSGVSNKVVLISGSNNPILAMTNTSASQQWGWYVDASGSLVAFNATATTNPVALSGAGNFGIGTTTPAAQLHTTGTVRFAGVPNCSSGIRTDGSGSLSCLTSSRRFKNITGALPYDVALANVMALRPQAGAYKKTPDVPEHWLIAEDVAAVDPALAGFADGKPYTVKTQNVVADLVAVVQYQQRQIDELKRALAEKTRH